MKRILILGSCVSRDILNFDHEGSLLLEGYYARSSLASMFGSCPFEEDLYSERLSSKFQQQIVHADISKKAISEIANTSADIILLDLIDERFNLFCTDRGVCTYSNEFLNTGAPNDVLDRRLIQSGSDEFFLMWRNGWRELIAMLNKLSLMPKLRLNKVFWAEKTESGLDFLPHYPINRIVAANEFLARLYREIEIDLDSDQIYEFSPDRLVGADEHRWGLSPFHYSDEYYKSALEMIKEG